MKKVVLLMLLFVLFTAAACRGEPSPAGSAPEGASSSPPGGERKTLDPCALLSDAQVEAAIGAPVAEKTSGEVPGALSCDYMADSSMPGATPHLFILAYTDETLAEFEDVGTGTAPEWWDNFYGNLTAGKPGEDSELSYSTEMSGIEVSIEEIPGLGEKALFYTIEDTTQQLWLLNDYAVFTLTITLAADEKGMEKERMRAVGEQLVAAMP